MGKGNMAGYWPSFSLEAHKNVKKNEASTQPS